MNDPIAAQPLYMSIKILALDVEIDENAPVIINDPQNFPDKEFSLDDLAVYDGHQSDANPDAKTYVAVNGFVYDVTGSVYGPGGSYESFGGRDASLALARYNLSPALLNKPVAGLERKDQKVRSFRNITPPAVCITPPALPLPCVCI
jgi:predicted heme/steroid binding protein